MSEVYEFAAGLVIDHDDHSWAELAHDFQRTDMEALVSGVEPRWRWLLRGRGMSKTLDTAIAVVTLLLHVAPRRAKLFWYAADREQAQVGRETIELLAELNPGLRAALTIESNRVTAVASKAVLSIEASEAAGALGRQPWCVVADELSAWPSQGHQRLLSHIESGLPKTVAADGDRFIVTCSAGSPAHFSYAKFQQAQGDPDWCVSVTPGPSPWWGERDVERLRRSMLPSDWAQLIECRWVAADDGLVSEADLDAAVARYTDRRGTRPLARVLGLDIGPRRDYTALSLVRADAVDGGRRVLTVERVWTWTHEGGQRLDFSELEDTIVHAADTYSRPKLIYDRYAAEHLVERLHRRTNLLTKEFVATPSSNDELARVMRNVFLDGTIAIPAEDAALRAELAETRLVSGKVAQKVRMEFRRTAGSGHGDRVQAVAMACLELDERVSALSKIHNPAGMVTLDGGVRVPRRGRLLGRPEPVSSGSLDPGEAAIVGAGRKVSDGLPVVREPGSYVGTRHLPWLAGSRAGWGRNNPSLRQRKPDPDREGGGGGE